MSIANLHSVLNDRWFIEKQYGNSLLPSLFAIINGQKVKVEASEKKPEEFIASKGIITAAVSGSSGSSQNDYVLVTNFKNAIYKYDQECGPSGTKSKMRMLEQYRNDPNCKGIVLDIDSGGGQVSGTPEFHDFLLNYSKPVVAYTDGYLCSAAYYIASGANHIVANKRADHIGSIGTMLSFIDFTGYYKKQGAKVITEYATKSTEKNKAFEELLKGNSKVIIAEELDPINDQFHADVKASRPGISDEVFAGATWNAEDSLKLNLIDSIGTLQDAIDKVFELSKPSTNKSNNTMSTKKLPRVEAVLGLKAPLAITENGSFLNEDQLAAVEGQLETLETNNETLTTQLAEATTANNTAVEAVQTQLTEATNSLTTAEASVDAALTNAGLPVEGSLTEKLTALNTYTATKGAEDGAKHTNVKTDANADSNLGVGSELDKAIMNS